jgi:hypothetical protein
LSLWSLFRFFVEQRHCKHSSAHSGILPRATFQIRV